MILVLKIIFPGSLDYLIHNLSLHYLVHIHRLYLLKKTWAFEAHIWGENYSHRVSHATPQSRRPDGLPALFYQKYWPIIHKSVINLVQHFFLNRKVLKQLNNTNIVLIPKKEHPNSPDQFHPISLCSVIYKIISSILVKWLKPIV